MAQSVIVTLFDTMVYRVFRSGKDQAAGVSWITIRRYFASGTMTSSCFFVRTRSSLSSSCRKDRKSALACFFACLGAVRRSQGLQQRGPSQKGK